MNLYETTIGLSQDTRAYMLISPTSAGMKIWAAYLSFLGIWRAQILDR
jgi:hypothetical protein